MLEMNGGLGTQGTVLELIMERITEQQYLRTVK